MEPPLVFFLVLAMTTFAAANQKIHASENPITVGSNVTLFSQQNISTGAWLFDNDIIMLIFQGSPIITDAWRGRVTYNLTTSSLTIRSLLLGDSGLYTLRGVTFRAQLTLSVQVPISDVTLRANATYLVEFNDTAVLMCSVLNGSSLSYVWLNGSSVVGAGGAAQLSDGGATLTLVRVTRYDKGPFRCNVSNGVSHQISHPVHLNISYGPSNTTITITPMKSVYLTGSNITLSCSAESSPPAMIRWMVDGVYLNWFGPQLLLESVTKNNSGYYQCLSHNAVTDRFSSNSAMIKIVAPVTMAAIRIVGAPPILNHTFTLTCETAGSVYWIAWMHGWNPLYPDNTTHFSADNSTLTFAALMTSDVGDYRCVASNPLSNLSSHVFNLELNYGPQMPIITGPSVGKTGYNVTLGCYASSHPPSSYKWYFNHSLVANTSMYVTPPLTMDMSGMYTCMAFNNVTGKNSTAYTMLTVYDPIEHVQVESPMTPAMEGHIYNLTCNVTGPVGHVYWMKNGGRLHEDNRTVFSMDNRTVTFHPLKRHDTGYYQCVASNAAWTVTSARYMFLVIFGPETPVIDGPAFAESGHSAVFRCSAASVPPSHFSWWFNGSNVANSSVFTTDPLSLNMSGEYTCMAYNNVTGNTSTSSKMLTVVEAIQSVVIRNHTVPINSENFTLTCDVTGPYDAIYWMKDDVRLNVTHGNHHMYYAIENGTLRFTPVTLHNDGTYQCVATNQAAAHESPEYMLLVNYGPLSVNISGPDSMAYGLIVTLTCSADSRPDCDFHWFFNDESRAMGSVIDFLATEENEGNYTCKARNPVTNITMYKTKAFTVAAHASALHLHHGGLMLMGLSVAVLFT